MCGIFGIIGEVADLQARGKQMAHALSHRGPDDEGIAVFKGAMVGNRRLSIIDVAGGHQPMLSDDEQIAVVQNGEIYNYVELKKELVARGVRFKTDSDTEVILRLYEAEGERFVHKLNGMFAIAIWDARAKRCMLYRDPVGMKPFFYTVQKDGLYFASEIKALLAAGIKPAMRKQALHHFLSFNFVPPTTTLFEDIESVPAGSMLAFENRKATIAPWWQPDLKTRDGGSEREWQDALMRLLDDAVDIHLRADVPVGAFLSGGIDSSTVVALASKHVKHKLQSFSIGFAEARFDESPFAQEVAAAYHTDHTNRIVMPDIIQRFPEVQWFAEQPHGDASFMPTLALSELAAAKVKVVVTGDGGDELLAGYERYGDFLEKNDPTQLSDDAFERAYFANQGLCTHAEKLALYTPAMAAAMKNVDSFDLMRADFDTARALDPINRILWIDLKWLLPANNLAKPDRMGMRASLEARVPFLDKRVIEFLFTMPGELKFRNGISKYILKQGLKPLLSERILNRPKRMFTVPIGEWFKDSLNPLLRSVLLSERAAARGIFAPDAVARLVEEHTSGAANHTRILRALLAVEVWQRLYLDGEKYDAFPEFIAAGQAAAKRAA